MAIREGTRVEWDWGDGTATGEVQEIFHDKVTRTIAGTEVTRNATQDDPAYLIKQANGDRVLKSQSEVSRADS